MFSRRWLLRLSSGTSNPYRLVDKYHRFGWNCITSSEDGICGLLRNVGACQTKCVTAQETVIWVLGPTQPPIQCVPGAIPPGVKRSGHEADLSPPTSVEVKNTWIYTSILPYTFMAYYLISLAHGQFYHFISWCFKATSACKANIFSTLTFTTLISFVISSVWYMYYETNLWSCVTVLYEIIDML
jgi:hypothetical protein